MTDAIIAIDAEAEIVVCEDMGFGKASDTEEIARTKRLILSALEAMKSQHTVEIRGGE